MGLVGRLLYKRYFDKLSKKDDPINASIETSKILLNNGKSIIADSIFRIKSKDLDKVFVFELHNGNNSKRIYDQIILHIEAMLSCSLHKQLGYPLNKAYYVLILFSEETTLEWFLKRFQSHRVKFQNIHQYFLCKKIKALDDNDFQEGWTTILSQPQNLEL